MKQKLLIVLFLTFLVAFGFAQAPKLVVMSEWPPFEYTENGVFKGSDVEIITAAFKEMKVPVTIAVYPWERCLKMIKEYSADVIITLSHNPEREAFLIYPKEPVNISQNVLFVRKGSTIKFNTYDDLKGLTVGTSSGYLYGTEFDTSTQFKKSEAVDENTNFKMLQAGRIDAFVCDKIVGVYMLKKLGISADIVFLPKVISEFKMFAAFGKKPGAAELAASFDKAMLAIKKSGVYQRIIDSYTK